ncbi:MAG TPA: hypothetical protein VGG62_14700, partial [Terracidiphilus sp.]
MDEQQDQSHETPTAAQTLERQRGFSPFDLMHILLTLAISMEVAGRIGKRFGWWGLLAFVITAVFTLTALGFARIGLGVCIDAAVRKYGQGNRDLPPPTL